VYDTALPAGCRPRLRPTVDAARLTVAAGR